MMNPQPYDVVLGSGLNSTITTAAVLGGHEKILGKLFGRFNSEAGLCNKDYLHLPLSPRVRLIRKKNADPLADIKIKVLHNDFWYFAGYLKHRGSLFGNEAFYDPARCESHLRVVAYPALIGIHQF